jgi:hypothetical protein
MCLLGKGRRTTITLAGTALCCLRRKDEIKLRDMDLTDPQISNRIQLTHLGKLASVSQQPIDLTSCSALIVGQSRQMDDLCGQSPHMGTVSQMPLTVGSIKVPGIQWDEPTDRIEHVDDGCLITLRVTYRCTQDRRDLLLTGKTQHPRGSSRRIWQTSNHCTGDIGDSQSGITSTMADNLDGKAAAERLTPEPECMTGLIGSSTHDRPTHI